MDIDKKAYWKAFQRNRDTFQSWSERRIIKALHEQVQNVLDVINEGAPQTLSNLSLLITKKPVEEMMKDLYGRVGGHFAERSYNQLRGEKFHKKQENQWIDWLRNYAVTKSGKRIQDITNTTLKRVQGVIQQGISEGLSTREIASRIENSNAINRVRARVIARTEIITASNAGHDAGARATGLELNKEWITTLVGARDDHIAVDGQVVAMNEQFIVGGQMAEFPGDPKLTADQACNCRCVLTHIPV